MLLNNEKIEMTRKEQRAANKEERQATRAAEKAKDDI